MASLFAVLLVAGAGVAILLKYCQLQTILFRKATRCPVTGKNTKHPSWEKSAPNARAEEEAKKKAETNSYKRLYYQVQNLEKFPEVLPFARQTLVSLLRQSVLNAKLQIHSQFNILKLEDDHSPERLAAFMAGKRHKTHVDWAKYQQRRQAGGGPEMFADREAARQWVKQNAPLQLVDGAWVARVHNVTTPYALRGITKNAWQTYCEELGDGDLAKNHCHIYRELCRSIGYEYPHQNDVDFIHPRHGLDNDRVWRASAGHLLISLFPNDFLPEILGFNLHYESLAPGTLKAARELPEFGISGYYFAVHISIDNAESGHSAMAEATINTYMEHVRKTGIMDVKEAWRRVQAGFLLSEYLDGDDDLGKCRDAVAGMIHAKAGVAGEVHCTSRARIGGRELTDWFSRDTLSSVSSSSWKDDFITALTRSKPWVYPGDSERGLLLKELSWKGRMFGAFTQNEVQCLRTWIDLLDDDPTRVGEKYWKLVGRADNGNSLRRNAMPETASLMSAGVDAATMHPAFPPQMAIPVAGLSSSSSSEFVPFSPLHMAKSRKVNLDALLPLWFMHPCILEQIVMSPYRTTMPLGSSVLRLLRAESGYMPESAGVAGMDEQRRDPESPIPSLTELGLDICRSNHVAEPTCLKDVLQSCGTAGGSSAAAAASVDFAYVVLSWAARPIENGTFLLGLSRAFLDLEKFVSTAANQGLLLSRQGCEGLANMIERKQDSFDKFPSLLKSELGGMEMFNAGYELGRHKIERLLVQEISLDDRD
ncbi:heme oxygenase-like, multi-helical [Metarhizium rileyi]|uniref:Heme oxygenase-like, multi-helical n=1 Tax=Metarhizium rileyi (strain RCEF 4871) TaxID=1649241 RepID=A0A166W1G3_METRR|nr:heme oxygenase-like, multi-helical [Metarhizium rileyi RCEF 4871]